MKNYVITIARGFGSGGKEIGSMLAKKLGIHCYENRIATMASEASGINELLFSDVDEKLRGSYISEKLKKMARHTFPIPVDKRFVSDQSMFNIQSDIIRSLAESESCVIVGKCANKILKDYENVLSVYIEAPRAACLKVVMDRMAVDENEAARLIEKTDKYRADYYKFYTNGDYWTNPVSYDLTLNSDRLGWENCIKIIENALFVKLNKE